jgi:hypothetical protein
MENWSYEELAAFWGQVYAKIIEIGPMLEKLKVEIEKAHLIQ